MRRIQTLTAQCIIAVTAAAPVLSMQFASREAAARYAEKELQKTLARVLAPADEDWGFLGRVYDAINSCKTEDIPNAAQKIIATEGLPSLEELAKKLEGTLRKALSDLEKKSKDKTEDTHDRDAHHTAFVRVAVAMMTVRTFHRTETAALFEEYVLSKDERVQKLAMQNYLRLAGAKAIPFLEKSITNGLLNDRNRQNIYQYLDLFLIPKLNEENKTDDITKFTTFLDEMKQAEQAKEKGEN